MVNKYFEKKCVTRIEGLDTIIGGNISVNSNLGSGSTFTVELPIDRQ